MSDEQQFDDGSRALAAAIQALVIGIGGYAIEIREDMVEVMIGGERFALTAHGSLDELAAEIQSLEHVAVLHVPESS